MPASKTGFTFLIFLDAVKSASKKSRIISPATPDGLYSDFLLSYKLTCSLAYAPSFSEKRWVPLIPTKGTIYGLVSNSFDSGDDSERIKSIFAPAEKSSNHALFKLY